MNKTQLFLKRNSSLILSIVSGIGVITTTALAIKATPKALELIEEQQKEKGDKLTPMEVVKTAWLPYVPTGISMFSTIACIFGSQYLNMRHQASLVSAYTVLDNAYKQYMIKAEEALGEEKALDVKTEMIKEYIDTDRIDLKNDEHLFFDYQTLKYFYSTFEQVELAEKQLNQELAATGFASVNDFYRFLGLPELEYSKYMGWTDEGHYQEMKFEHQRVEMDDGLECWIIVTEEPLIDLCQTRI